MRVGAALALIAALVAASPASAQRWGGRGGGWRARGGSPAAAPGWGGGGFRGGPGRRWGGGGYGAPQGGWRDRGDGPMPGPPQAFAPQPPAQAFRRGQIVPQDYRGARVDDPGRYHLRSAPNGFDWVGDGRDAYLVQRSTGMVMDSAPGAYEGPRGGGRGRGRWGGRF